MPSRGPGLGGPGSSLVGTQIRLFFLLYLQGGGRLRTCPVRHSHALATRTRPRIDLDPRRGCSVCSCLLAVDWVLLLLLCLQFACGTRARTRARTAEQPEDEATKVQAGASFPNHPSTHHEEAIPPKDSKGVCVSFLLRRSHCCVGLYVPLHIVHFSCALSRIIINSVPCVSRCPPMYLKCIVHALHFLEDHLPVSRSSICSTYARRPGTGTDRGWRCRFGRSNCRSS